MRGDGTDQACAVRVLSAVRRKASRSPRGKRSTVSPARTMASPGAHSSWLDQDSATSESRSNDIFSPPTQPDQAPSPNNDSRSLRGARSTMSPARAMASLGRDSAGSQSQSDHIFSLPPQPASISSQDSSSRSPPGARIAISPASAIGQDDAGSSDHGSSLPPQAGRPRSPDNIYSLHPPPERSPSLPRSSPSPPPRTPTYTRRSFAFQVAQSSPLVSPTPSSLRASPPLEEAIHAQHAFSLSPPPEYTPPRRRGSSEAVESQLAPPLPVLGKRRRPSPASDTESDTPARASNTPVRAVSPPRFGRRSGEMKLLARAVPPSQRVDSKSTSDSEDADSSKESDDERPRQRARGSWVRDAVACIDELDITVDSGPPRTQAHRAFASSQPVDVY
jgi:hypothetical protein